MVKKEKSISIADIFGAVQQTGNKASAEACWQQWDSILEKRRGRARTTHIWDDIFVSLHEVFREAGHGKG